MLKVISCYVFLWLCSCAAFQGYGQGCPLKSKNVPPVSAALLRSVWEAKYGALPNCPVWSWEVWTVPEMNNVCLTSEASACTIYPDGCPLSLTIAANDTCYSAAHEFAHFALWCQAGMHVYDGDPQHLRSDVWTGDGFVVTVCPMAGN